VGSVKGLRGCALGAEVRQKMHASGARQRSGEAAEVGAGTDASASTDTAHGAACVAAQTCTCSANAAGPIIVY